MEPRSAYRGGPKIPTPVDTGTAYVTDQSIRFHGATKNVEWRFDKMHAVGTGHDGYQFSVSNRQLVSGISASGTARPAVDVAVRWAMTLATGTGLHGRRTEAAASRYRLAQELQSAKSELTSHELPSAAAGGYASS